MKSVSLLEELKAKIIPILKEHKVTRAGIFGSFARGEQTSKSDIDILFQIENGADLIEIIGLKLKLEKQINRKVDLVEYETIRKEIRESILNEEINIITSLV